MKRRDVIKSLSLLSLSGLSLPMKSVLAKAPQSSKNPQIVDTHVETWNFNFPFNHPENPRLNVTIEAPIENQVEQMKEFGIDRAVLINPRYYGWDNSYVANCIKRFPDLFVGHGLLNPEDPRIANNLRYWVEGHGFSGMRFSPIYHPKSTWLNSPEHYSLWREAERLGVVFNFYIAPHQMPMLEDMAGRFPDVKIVVDHAGKPDLKSDNVWEDYKKMFRLKKFPQVWISQNGPYEMSVTKEYPYEDTWPFYKAVYEEFGTEQMVWGTGYPGPRWELPMDKELEFVYKYCDWYSDEDLELLMGKNALRIWDFKNL